MKSDTGYRLVLVHGPLRRGGSQAKLTEGGDYLRTVEVSGFLYAAGSKAYLCLDPAGTAVTCDLYRVGPGHFQELDRLQQAAGHSPVALRFDPEDREQTAVAWVWKHPLEDVLKVESGDWIDHVSPRASPHAMVVALMIPLLFAAAISASIASSQQSREASQTYLGIGAVLFFGGPIVGFVALNFAKKRGEKWGCLRNLVMIGYVLWAIVAGLYAIAGATCGFGGGFR
ncbi:gamma-glutamylcyclotransferase [Haloferula sp. BvORR071]|uniref:gamma-glutamylcyclotransferase n=1 Tax=Haloferula sp. BvORR071 TaxID=1396141 RepID=UPI00055445CD|nr:gamma-glutamylcyclotransferase [Haloferula sp. BvORR071]